MTLAFVLLALAAPRVAGASPPAAPLYAEGLTDPGGQVWMGTHLWVAEDSGLCRLDADGTGTFAINPGLCTTTADFACRRDVQQLPGKTLTGAGSVNVAWFGRNTAGALVAPGTYQASVKAVDLAGNEATATINVVVS